MLRVRLGASACRLYAAICTWGVLIWAPAPAAPRRAATSSSSDELIVPSDPIVPEYLRVPKDTFRTPWRYADDCKLMEVMYHTHWAMEASGFSRWLDANAPDWLLRSWEEAGVSAVDAATVLFADVRVWADRLRRVPEWDDVNCLGDRLDELSAEIGGKYSKHLLGLTSMNHSLKSSARTHQFGAWMMETHLKRPDAELPTPASVTRALFLGRAQTGNFNGAQVHGAVWHYIAQRFAHRGSTEQLDGKAMWRALTADVCPFSGVPASVYFACLHGFGHGVAMSTFIGAPANRPRVSMVCPGHSRGFEMQNVFNSSLAESLCAEAPQEQLAHMCALGMYHFYWHNRCPPTDRTHRTWMAPARGEVAPCDTARYAGWCFRVLATEVLKYSWQGKALPPEYETDEFCRHPSLDTVRRRGCIFGIAHLWREFRGAACHAVRSYDTRTFVPLVADALRIGGGGGGDAHGGVLVDWCRYLIRASPASTRHMDTLACVSGSVALDFGFGFMDWAQTPHGLMRFMTRRFCRAALGIALEVSARDLELVDREAFQICERQVAYRQTHDTDTWETFSWLDMRIFT